MYPDKYNTAIENYCMNQEKVIQRLSEKGFIDSELTEISRRTTRENIKQYLIGNEEYGKLLLSLSYIENPVDEYVSLTQIARERNCENPSYVIQGWLRSKNTLNFLRCWEKDNNPDFDEAACEMLIEKTKVASFTHTAKQWIEQTKAIGLTSKQGKSGGTLAHHIIALDFQMWMWPEKRYQVMKFVADDLVKL